MYYADPADEGEPSSGFFYAIAAFLISILFFSCINSNQQPRDLHHTLVKDSVITLIRPADLVKQATPTTKKKKIYLTFDDGPNKGTKNVLDIIREEAIPVSFFIVGEHVFASNHQAAMWDSLNTMPNIELCNHSYTHALHNKFNKYYEKPDTVVKDMQRTRDELLPGNLIVRTPGRNTWRIDSLHFTDNKKSKAAVDSLQKAGFIVMGWDLEWHYDHKTLQVKNTADDLINQVDSLFKKGKTKVKDNLVILAHDQVYQKSADSLQLREFIQKLKKKEEYELALVSHYPGIKKESGEE